MLLEDHVHYDFDLVKSLLVTELGIIIFNLGHLRELEAIGPLITAFEGYSSGCEDVCFLDLRIELLNINSILR